MEKWFRKVVELEFRRKEEGMSSSKETLDASFNENNYSNIHQNGNQSAEIDVTIGNQTTSENFLHNFYKKGNSIHVCHFLW